MSVVVEMVRGSVEYLYGDVTADRILDGQPVAIALAESVAQATWLPATWVGDAGTTRSCAVLLDGTLPAGRYGIYVRVTDAPEVPIVKAGVLKVKE